MNAIRRLLVPILVLAVYAPAACLGLTYDENINGDLSNIGSSVTGLGTLNVGSNLLVATSGGGDFDHIGFNVGAATQLDSIVLTTYGGASQSFTALQNGTVWTAGTGVSVNPAATLGWTHFGPAAAGANVGNNLLPSMSTAAGAIGFTPPLGSGVYNMLLQDTGGTVSYSLTFNVSAIPEPTSATLLTVATLAGCIALRRR